MRRDRSHSGSATDSWQYHVGRMQHRLRPHAGAQQRQGRDGNLGWPARARCCRCSPGHPAHPCLDRWWERHPRSHGIPRAFPLSFPAEYIVREHRGHTSSPSHVFSHADSNLRIGGSHGQLNSIPSRPDLQDALRQWFARRTGAWQPYPTNLRNKVE